MYTLPPELSARIFEILNDEGIYFSQADEIHEEIAALLVRENRRLRQQILRLGSRFVKAAEDEKMNHSGSCSAYTCDSVCRYVANKIVKPNVYIDKEETIERLIQDFYNQDDNS